MMDTGNEWRNGMAEKATNDGPFGEKKTVYTELTPYQYQAAINHTWIALDDATPEQIQSFEAALV
jgi:hypothetical protein